ncbi:MAG: DNA mismatch repair endonuclease MutL [Planctomycetota bacterium]
MSLVLSGTQPFDDPPAPDRPVIRRLAPLLVNQIAAGEVIERPASVVKELVENAIDAGATRITVELEEGGVKLVRVTDDGVGLDKDDLPLALTPHATSKIAEADDLDRIATMGFRGEALASIASVARVSIRSRVRGAESGWSIACEGGATREPTPAAGPIGTSVTVRELFFNTPARRKFLRTERTEKGRCLDWVRDLAMAHPLIGFTVIDGDTKPLELPANQTPRQRAVALLGKELEGELLEVAVDQFDDERGVLVWGLIGRPSIARPTARAQHLFLNGRTIKDRTVLHALKEGYRGLIDPGRHPTAVLLLETSPTAVDVNVHPAKLEVRFRDSSAVHRAVLTGVRRALQEADLTPTVEAKASPQAPMFGPVQADLSAVMFAERVRESRDDARLATGWSGPPTPAPPSIFAGPNEPPVARRAERVLQVMDSYLVVEDGDGILLIDQHALHERVMFQTLLERLGQARAQDGSLEHQKMLTPAVGPCESSALERLDEVGDLLRVLGIEASLAGPTSVGVHAFPSLLLSRKVEPASFVAELLQRVDRGEVRVGSETASEAALHEVLDMMACKAAVKAGDPLSEHEIAELLRLRETVERSSSCPHGRPTSIRIGRSEIERLFARR